MKNVFPIVVFSMLLTTSLFAQETKIELPTANNTSSFTVTGTDADRSMKFFADGGFYLTGENNAGTIPISGAGGRVMWFPGMRAFRAGYVDGAQWNADNIGRYSIATGVSTMASGVASTALGYCTTASGDNSTAMGRETTASGVASIAMGEGTIASIDASTVVGRYNVADNTALFLVGGGNTDSQRKNLFKVDLYGNVDVGGDLIAKDLWTRFHGGGTEYRLGAAAGFVTYTIATFSDRRLKENVITIASPLQKIQRLRGVTFNWNSTAKDMFINELKENVRPDPSLPESVQQNVMQETVDKKLEELAQTEISFIAQEVEAVFPEWVTEDENGYKKIDMKGLNGLLVEAVKELKTEKDEEIATLENKNKELENEIAELKESVEAMKTLVAQMTAKQ